ncbi:DNL zinc finger containing protein [Leishmania donovani]|uniref:DNL_zinc_finger_containing_protein_-_putative n=3 Tax=Leishmania donovani species complex TaxID=38574 RepID=A0A6L0XQB8_LEIIN|nr:conserved hypothetical protein [Leishmania infantum JPCM5]CAC9493866.1 DNL_zinc_finger_containing_protein_-_putative [Leishmania infantum]CAJ1989407.1 DNL zinc finger containing protein [Leishmania donovani]CAM68551.1 conserved hypothetical protein [Leishmania infantum JPCM5]SUZ42408.1 DNL_zinc_finger_containing_protein_-_putative [Leishmania infantum]VDZ45274.1 DNL_zinc_finger_containing_protein_putative/Pfam:PF05180 [Leishmania donovani]|eukprot:XP_001466113.1 conserved hypothetical protein [Leishmania infantum JPCM5]
MLRRPALLSVPRRPAVLRGLRAGTRAASALAPRLQPALQAQSSCASFSAASLAASSRRWCSTGSSSSDNPSRGHSEAKTPLTDTSAAAPTGLAAHDDATASTTTVAEHLKHLSPEDQQRIIAALQAPEKEKSSVMGGAGIGPADGDMVAAFTCGPCDYRMVKRFSKHAYTKGIVIVECPNCRAKHLLADNLGWMEDTATNIEDILKAKGESFVRIGGAEGDYQVVMDPALTTSSTPFAATQRP